MWRGVLCRGAFNRCAGQVLGTQRCRGALPSAGPAAQGVAVPGGRLGASWPLWASGRVGCSQDICLLASSLGGLTCPGLVSTLLSPILALGPVSGHAGPPRPAQCSFSLLSSSAPPPPPPARPLALPGVTDAPLLACTYTLPPPRARSAACLSCTFQQPPGALKRPLRF